VSDSAGRGWKRKGKKERGEDWLRQGGSRGDVVGVSKVFGDAPAWLERSEGDSMEVIGEEGTLAQMYAISLVHSSRFKKQLVMRSEIPYGSASSSYKPVSPAASSCTTQHEHSP
jgi:hypothetical protein